MTLLIWDIAPVVAAFLVHLAVWRLRVPRRQARAVVLVFLAMYLATVGAALVCTLAAGPRGWLPSTPFEYLHVTLFYAVMTAGYVITYSAVEVDSPTLVMAVMLMDAGAAGLSKRELLETLTDEVLVVRRIEDLVTDRMASLEDGRYRLTRKGALLARLFDRTRGVLGVSELGG